MKLLSRKLLWNLIPGLLFLLVILSSCQKFEGDQTIPAYISVDTFILANNSFLELGITSHKITDVWVYVDDQIIGAFELPVERIPVLAEGKHKLTLVPGIKYNGMSGTRGPYPFMQPDIDTGFIFVVDSIIKVQPVVKYYNSTYAAWMEDFDDESNSLQPSVDSDTSLYFLNYDTAHVLYGNASGIGYLDPGHLVLEVASYNEEVAGIKLPTTSAPVFLEMQYNIDIPLTVGLFIIETGVQIIRHPIVVLNPTDGQWKKVYVNMTPTVSDYGSQADYFNVFFRAENINSLNSTVIKIDNLKLLSNQVP
jgi:hypothetical protein